MIKLMVDYNIIFSAILNVNSRIGQILLTSDKSNDFYAPKYVRDEIFNHQGKLKNIAKLGDNEFLEVYELVLKNITILDHSIAGKSNYKKAFELCKDADLDDIPFVAFALYLKSKLWTGEKKLIKGLKDNGFDKIVTTNDLFDDFLKKN
ncbi:PIN domain-containing protein [Psychroflexus maritimus]|uniref:Nucleotide-binding protein n=1 Tax=Psychroflexus maritimus TaxID=2714865 RepID=A0A967DZH1_9FLAO|nr:PIN domain-containing protein [Psychroflexus maritimus]NGZ90198.1 nucleotide-binding protein [Psychroflexus maritimus]